MTLQEKLNTLYEQKNIMLKYKMICIATGSILDYSREDFERESMILRKIEETKALIKKVR